MEVQRAAAPLRGRHVHLAAVAGQHADGRLHGGAVEDGHDAAGEQPDAMSHRTLRRVHLPRCAEGRMRKVGQRGLRLGHWPHKAQDAACPYKGAQPRALVQPQRPADGAHPAGARQHLRIRQPRHKAAQHTGAPGAHLRLRLLDEPAVGNPRGACRLAGAALDAEVPVLDDPRLDAGPPLEHGLHQRDAAPRRFRLKPRFDVRGARVEAEAAVDAPVEVLFTGRVRAHEARRDHLAAHAARHYSPPTNRPELRRPCGSNWRLSPSMTVNPSPGGPHGSTPGMGS